MPPKITPSIGETDTGYSPLHPASDSWSTLELVTFGEDFDGSETVISENIDPRMLSLASLVGARNRHPSTRLDQIPTESVLDDFERNRYALDAPTLDEQCLDTSRTGTFSYTMEAPDSSVHSLEKTELSALRELRYFLEIGASTLQQRDLTRTHDTQELLDTVASIKDRLTFIGNPEFQRATTILGAYWSKFLASDPLNKVFVVTGISNSDKYPNQIKSDQHLFNAIDERYGFTSPESPYGGRLTNGIEGLESADPEHTKIVLLDDWALSGTQVSREYFSIIDSPGARRFSNRIEANFIAASDRRIRLGIDVSRQGTYKTGNEVVRLPVMSVYQAHTALVDTPRSSGTHITGLHSSANFGFSFPLDTVCRNQRKSPSALPLPSLARVTRSYGAKMERNDV